ncbi:hypothetical protein FOU55_22115 [Salmonella enterica]|nr:hypothetical protein [Salmonella enterica]
MKLTRIAIFLGMAILTGCANPVVNQDAYYKLQKMGLENTKEQAYYGKKDQTLTCANDRDEAFNIKFNTITETTLPKPLQYVPIINIAGGFMQEDTKFQNITYNNFTFPYGHIGRISLNGQKMDIYNYHFGATKNWGDLLYVYADKEGAVHAFRTESGIIPKSNSFYACR